ACLAAGAPPPSSKTTSTSPTGITSSTAPRSSSTLPALGAPMVTVALSVMTSTISWSSLTVSPSATSQPTISPSVTPSPISGSLNSNFDILLVTPNARAPLGCQPQADRQRWRARRGASSSSRHAQHGRQNPVRKRHVLHLQRVGKRSVEPSDALRRRLEVVENLLR